jgi:hypothetical protein
MNNIVNPIQTTSSFRVGFMIDYFEMHETDIERK